jgi:hypothetical protein
MSYHRTSGGWQNVYGKKRPYTDLFLNGIADTLAFLATRDGSHMVTGTMSVADYAVRVVHRLLEWPKDDWLRWASLASFLPILMEAAPDITLAFLERGLKDGDSSPVAKFFDQKTDSVFGSSPHHHLLRALERVAWNPDYLSRVTLILGKMVSCHGGDYSRDTPLGSLQSIFFPWPSGTTATLEKRMVVIDGLRQRHPDVAWDLMIILLPEDGGVIISPNRPRWRDWVPDDDQKVTTQMLLCHTEAVADRLLEDVGVTGSRWLSLIDKFELVSPRNQQAIIVRLSQLAKRSLAPRTRTDIWNALRLLLSNHRTHASAWWAMSVSRLREMEQVFNAFEPTDLIDSHAHLFSNDYSCVLIYGESLEAQREIIQARQTEAATLWIRELSIERIICIGVELDLPCALGAALARSGGFTREKEVQFLQLSLGHVEPKARLMGRSYLVARFQNNSQGVIAFLGKHGPDWPRTVHAEALLSVPPDNNVRTALDAMGDKGRAYYWQHFIPAWPAVGDVGYVLRELLHYKRSHLAAKLAAMYVRQGYAPPLAEDVRDVLVEAAQSKRDEVDHDTWEFAIPLLFAFLKDEMNAGRIDGAEVARLEFIYLPYLSRHSVQPETVYQMMGQDPSFFADMIRHLYQGSEGDRGDQGEGLSPRFAQRAFGLLLGWRTPPGQKDDTIDAQQLNAWIDRARRLLADAQRAEIGDEYIGQMLSGSSLGSDGIWPAEAIREVVERLESDELDSGLRIGRRNQRGAVWSDPLAGGDKERKIQERYLADASQLAHRWPRTAAILRAIADSYARDAAREDFNTELFHDL